MWTYKSHGSQPSPLSTAAVDYKTDYKIKVDPPHRGAVAQLGERRVRNAKVGSSILLRSTNFLDVLQKPTAVLSDRDPQFTLIDTILESIFSCRYLVPVT